MELQDILLVSDIDGTLIDSQYQIPPRNREAIQRFMKKGGGFSIATGRSWESVLVCLGDLTVNRPCVLANGGLVYDLNRRQAVSVQALPETAYTYTKRIMERFPHAGIEVFTPSDLWIVRENDVTRQHLENERIGCRFGSIDSIQEPWCKMLVAMKEQPELIAFTNSFCHEDVRFVASSDRYWEMLPKNVDKGTGLRELSKVCGCPIEHIAAIGDYDNDIEMLQIAGITAAPANASEKIRSMVDLTTCHCQEGAVADFIEYLERIYEGGE